MESARKRQKFRPVQLITMLVMVVAGVLLSVSALNPGSEPRTRAGDLQASVLDQVQSVKKAEKHNAKLRKEVDSLIQNQENSKTQVTVNETLLSASKPVRGPGVVVQLTDAPVAEDASNPDIYVVHQQDVEAVMNALWSGRAEAMTVQGARVTLNSKIRCVGNVIYVDGEVFSPPYEIAAIGDPKSLQEALKQDDTLEIYQQYVKRYGLGYLEEVSDTLNFPAGTKQPTYMVASTLENS
ncbi:DUF881 domain-containing protein [Boudabousia marimammalium]|uniref:DUF881 domain-containing protein n=1 Tax=Boudabousia marimammalium TaxID=156892 RepID=A0A1Q5PT42_9ACTO|nr:DUF881 domain-containing protein [Boudabousia marimammalium]OKL50550.1 hypothetical protein BM477_00855 [Boudabousia marimammalium]